MGLHIFHEWVYYDPARFSPVGSNSSIMGGYYLSKRKCKKCGFTQLLQDAGHDRWVRINE